MTGRFKGVDLGGSRTMERLVRAEKEKRDAIIEECAVAAAEISVEAAEKVRALKGA